jgi:isoquinoline 1-oxidoreductase subunit alpha
MTHRRGGATVARSLGRMGQHCPIPEVAREVLLFDRDEFTCGNDMANAIQFKVNGVARSFDGDPDTPLLWYLRDSLGLTGTKFGCGVGLCGACTIHKNGDAIRACITPMSSLAGAEIRTIEDIGANGLHPVQKMWMQFNVPQCGYCQSGQIMQAIALLKSKPKPTDEDIDEGMAANICRCGTYQRIRAAIKAAAQEPA